MTLVLLLPSPESLCTLESDAPPETAAAAGDERSLFDCESFTENLLSSIEWCCSRHQLPVCTTRAVALVAACDTAAAALQQVLRGLVGVDEVTALRRAVDAVQRLRERSERAWSARRWLGDLLANARTRSAQHALRLLKVSIFAPNGLMQSEDVNVSAALAVGLQAGGSRSLSRTRLHPQGASQPGTPQVGRKPRRPELKRSGSISRSRGEEVDADDDEHVDVARRPEALHIDALQQARRRAAAAAAYLYPPEESPPADAFNRLVLLTESTRSTSTNSSGRSPWSQSHSSAGSSSPPTSALPVSRPSYLHMPYPQPPEADARGFAHVGVGGQLPIAQAAAPEPDVTVVYQFPQSPNGHPAGQPSLYVHNGHRMMRQTSNGAQGSPVSAQYTATPIAAAHGDADWMHSTPHVRPADFSNRAFEVAPDASAGWPPPPAGRTEPFGAQLNYQNAEQFVSPTAHTVQSQSAATPQRSVGGVQFALPPPPQETARVFTVYPAYETGLEGPFAALGADDSPLRMYR